MLWCNFLLWFSPFWVIFAFFGRVKARRCKRVVPHDRASRRVLRAGASIHFAELGLASQRSRPTVLSSTFINPFARERERVERIYSIFEAVTSHRIPIMNRDPASLTRNGEVLRLQKLCNNYMWQWYIYLFVCLFVWCLFVFKVRFCCLRCETFHWKHFSYAQKNNKCIISIFGSKK